MSALNLVFSLFLSMIFSFLASVVVKILSCSIFLSGEYLDILAVSCDSFDEATNQLIGRAQGRKSHIDNLYKIRNWCQEYKVAFKINSVINSFNIDEDMTEQINELNPVRWKVRINGRRETVSAMCESPSSWFLSVLFAFRCSSAC